MLEYSNMLHITRDRPRRKRFLAGLTAWVVVALLALGASSQAVAARPQVWGYGVKGCPEFLRAALPVTPVGDGGAEEQVRFREWFAGVVTGLSLATDLDVLRGRGIEEAIERLRRICEARPGDDFFTAVNVLIGELNQPASAPGPAAGPAAASASAGGTPEAASPADKAVEKPKAQKAPSAERKPPAAGDCKGGGAGSIANNPGGACP
jgi:hypothetical protein